MKKTYLIILIILFLSLLVVRTIKISSNQPTENIIALLRNQGYENIKIIEGTFSYCPKLLSIPVYFQASINQKTIEGLACFSPLSNVPRIQFKN